MASKVSGASLSKIYDRLNNAPTYHPLEADTFADWSMEAGDVVNITRDGNTYKSPVHSSTIKWQKGQQIRVSSTGSEKRDPISRMSQRKYNRGGTALRNNQYLHYYVEDQYKQMKAGLDLTTSSAFLYVQNAYTRMSSGLKLTSSSAYLYVQNSYTQMKSGLALTTSTAHLYVQNAYTQMKSGLALTTSSAYLYVQNSYTQMKSGLALTTSTAHLYVQNAYTQMQSGLKLTTSTAYLYVSNAYTQMSSGLKLTTSSAFLYVQNAYTQMSSGLKLSENSARLYAQSRTSKAEIIARINEDGGSEALINADRVSISGRTTINDVMTITDNRFNIIVDTRISGNVMAQSIELRSGNDDNTITAPEFAGMIKSASVSSNVLTLTRVDGSTLTFSKATSLGGAWSGTSGIYTVTATPQGNQCSTELSEILTDGTPTRSGMQLVQPCKVTCADTTPEPTIFTDNITIGLSSVFSSMTITRSKAGRTSSGTDVYYGKLYYWDEDAEEYVQAVSGNHYWYYSSTNRSGTNTVYY